MSQAELVLAVRRQERFLHPPTCSRPCERSQPVGVAGVVSKCGGDAGFVGQARDGDRDVAERAHNLRSVAGPDLGAASVPGHTP